MADGIKHVFVTGPTGFVGFRVVRALLDEGASVTALVRPGSEEKLGPLQVRVNVVTGDVWNPASLKGRARGHQVAIHLIGGMHPDPKRGVTFRTLNYDSARNVMQMAVSDGVPHFMLLSAARNLPGVQSAYIDNKRDAEQYLQTTGLAWTILRPPPMYAPGVPRHPAYMAISLLRWIPVLNLFMSGFTPLSADVVARAIARLALNADTLTNRIITPNRLRSLGRAPGTRQATVADAADPTSESALDEAPFGWLP